MRKYYGDTGGPEHGGKLFWPGTPEGFPVRGQSPPLLYAHEYTSIPLVFDYHSRLFRLFVPEEKAEFDRIMDRIVNGWYHQHRRIDRWCDEHGGLVVWLEWVQVYGEASATGASGEADLTQQGT